MEEYKERCIDLIKNSEGTLSIFVVNGGRVEGHCFGGSEQKHTLTRELFDACGDFGRAIARFERGFGNNLDGCDENFHITVCYEPFWKDETD